MTESNNAQVDACKAQIDACRTQVDTCRAQIDGIVVDTLHQLREVFVDLGSSETTTEREFKDLVEDARDFFRSKLLPKLTLRGITFSSNFPDFSVL